MIMLPKSIGLLLSLTLLAGCVAGPGKKPSTLKWKEYKDDHALAFTPAAWTRGSLKFELTEVKSERRYTVLGTKSRSLRFYFRVTNTGAAEADVFEAMAKGSLALSDGSFVERLTWTASKVKLAPGAVTEGMYFTDISLNEGLGPKKLAIDGNTVASW
jgi:hypothetical protein